MTLTSYGLPGDYCPDRLIPLNTPHLSGGFNQRKRGGSYMVRMVCMVNMVFRCPRVSRWNFTRIRKIGLSYRQKE